MLRAYLEAAFPPRYTEPMSSVRSVPLFEPAAQPPTWNERMVPGEFAVHESCSKNTSPVCAVLPSFEQAEDYAKQQVALRPTVRCRIYDHQGFVGAPLAEFRGASFKGESDFSPKVRRWFGAFCLVLGTLLVLVDWYHDFRLSWPAVVGSRLLIPGLLLLATEVLIVLQAKYGTKKAKQEV